MALGGPWRAKWPRVACLVALIFFERAPQIFFGASGVHLGELLAAFGSILGPPGGARRGSGRSFGEVF